MRQNNYAVAFEKARELFLSYDQAAIIKKLQAEHDDDYIYTRFFAREYRVSRHTGVVEWSEDGFITANAAGFDDGMTVYDLLCWSMDGAQPAGRYTSVAALGGHVHGTSLFSSGWAKAVDENPDGFISACISLGGQREAVGDIAFSFEALPKLRMMVQFWHSDDEFPANLKFMWDENATRFIHYETLYYAQGHFTSLVRKAMDAK